MSRILVTGATGRIGREVVAGLLAARAEVRALTRDPAAARLPAGVEVVPGDLTLPESLEAGLDDVDAVFLVWTAPAATAPEVVARIAAHARHLVLLSSPHRTAHPFFQQPNALRALHEHLDDLVASSGVAWTILRPGMFASNALFWWAPRIRAGDVVRWPYGAVETAPVHERDVADVAVCALCGDAHAGADYVLTGPASLSQSAQVRTIGEVIGRSLRFEEMSPDEALRELGMPPAVATMLLRAWGAALGQPAYVTHSVEAITGTPARTFRAWAAEHAAAFLAAPGGAG
jgi:uncharacterized protein YbjT (DUF2867 family)